MENRRKVVAAVIVLCCMAVALSGCQRLGWGKKKSVSEIPELTPLTNEYAESTGSVLPARDAFEKGTRVSDTFENVLFDFDSAQIADMERVKIETVAAYMKNKTATVVILNGNCDERGSNEYNMSLGERRSLATRAYLVGLGVDAARIQTRSYGEEKPLNPGHDEDAWRVNRRVEFEVLH
jgi:peptidoglycan-associated lipoprotein